MKLNKSQITALLLLACFLLMFVPWLGLTPYNTKGEPREAIVAVSMLQSGNWILPVSFGADIPYKPPFLAWCIALISYPWGHVSEFSSRLPSAVAAICLALSTFCFIRRRLGGNVNGVMSAVILVSCVEVWRAAMACRVDMVLTAFIFGALISLYRYRESGYRGVPWGAWICMTCGVLTKGPVGALLPCLVAGMFGLLRGDRFFPLLCRMSALAIASLVLPAAWYWAAYKQGGDEFIALAIEENIGRVTGTMSYSSHEKGLWYNFVTVVLGVLPYTVLGLMALFVVRWREVVKKARLQQLWHWLRNADSAKVFTVVATVVIFVFYCVPKSKRSVYLLPIYPFLAYFVFLLINWLISRKPMLVRVYGAIIAFVGFVIGVVVVAWPLVPLDFHPSPVGVAVGVVGLAGSVYLGWILWMRRTIWCERTAIAVTMLTLTTVAAGVLPEIGRLKDQKSVAEDIARLVPEGPVYEYINVPMLRFYELNYYLGDRMRLYEKELPEKGVMLVPDSDVEEWQRAYGELYSITPVAHYSLGVSKRAVQATLYMIEIEDNSK